MNKKLNVPDNTVTRTISNLDCETGNIYETVAIIARRANQISAETKLELQSKLQDFNSVTDNLEETFENREQIEVSKFYERLPKASLVATEEFLEDKIEYHHKRDEVELQPEEAELSEE